MKGLSYVVFFMLIFYPPQGKSENCDNEENIIRKCFGDKAEAYLTESAYSLLYHGNVGKETLSNKSNACRNYKSGRYAWRSCKSKKYNSWNVCKKRGFDHIFNKYKKENGKKWNCKKYAHIRKVDNAIAESKEAGKPLSGGENSSVAQEKMVYGTIHDLQPAVRQEQSNPITGEEEPL